MASLTAGLKLGTGSASSLIKSAGSIASQIAAYQDASQAYQYELSAKTDQDLQTYQAYLQTRITNLNATGTISDASKSLSLTRALSTAVKGNISSSILRENIQIMAGNATEQDKLNLIGNQFQRALNNGDMNLAQSLESQAYSLSQTIQLKAQQAADAAASLRTASASSANSSQDHVATQIENQFKQLNADAGAGGMAKLNGTLKSWVNTNKAQFTALANDPTTAPQAKQAILKAISTSQPNYFDIAQGVTAAMATAHYLAATAEGPINPQTAQSYYDKYQSLMDGSTKIATLAGPLSAQEIQMAQQNPAAFPPKENADSGTLKFTYAGSSKLSGTSAITGYKFGADGTVVANFSANMTNAQLSSDQAKQITSTLDKLGFSYDKSAVKAGAVFNNGVTVQASKSPKWLQPILAGQQNVQLQTYQTKQGIVTATLNGPGKGNIYLIATDAKGLHGVYQATGQFQNGNPVFGKQIAHGDYGFNQGSNTLWNPGGTTKVSNKPGAVTKDQYKAAEMHLTGHAFGVDNLMNNIGSLLGIGAGHAEADKAPYLNSSHSTEINSLVMSAQQKFQQIQVARQAEQAKLAAQVQAQQAQQRLQMAAAARPAPAPSAPNRPQSTYNPQPMTYNPQPATHNPQQTAPASQLQGGSVNGFNLNQSGSGGIKLGSSSGAGIKL